MLSAIVSKNPGYVNLHDEAGDTALHRIIDAINVDDPVAPYTQALQAIIFLVRHGCRVDVKGHLRRTPLHLAARYCLVSPIKQLIRLGSDVQEQDIYGFTPLHLAICDEPLVYDRIPALKILLKSGADVNIKTHDGYSVFDAAKDNPEVMELLMNRI